MKTKWICLLIIWTTCMMPALGAVAGQPAAAPLAPPENALKVASMTRLSGDFFTDLWGNNTSDMDVRGLIHGYSTVAWNRNGNYELDQSVLADTKITSNSKGTTYQFTLREGLCYNDGTPITARDYVFSLLLLSDPRMTALGAVPDTLRHILGFDAYVEGVNKALAKQGTDPDTEIAVPFSGVRLLSDLEFALTIDKKALPFFYELSLVSAQPYPMELIAPGCELRDTGRGAFIEGPFTTELLKDTVLDPDTGYRFHPTRTAGPYRLVAYDARESTALFEKNPYYLGNFEGQKPVIDAIYYCLANQDTMLADLQEGRLDVLNKVSSGVKIEEGRELVSQEMATTSYYPRSGLSFLSFACEAGLAESVNVRKAIAMCVDVQTLCDEYLMGYGLPAYGYYGYGQWMTVDTYDELLNLAQYSLNLNAARGLLEADGWVLGADGLRYDDEAGGVRYRLAQDGTGETLVPLTIRVSVPEGIEAAAQLVEMLRQSFGEIGIDMDVTVLPFSTLLRQYYRQDARAYDMAFLASNFLLLFDPYYTFSTLDEHQGVFNTTGLRDDKLMELALQMRRTMPGDTDDYVAKWLAFQERFVQVLPIVPLYSNIYFDFYRPDLYYYSPNANWSFASAIVYAAILDEPPVEEFVPEDVVEITD